MAHYRLQFDIPAISGLPRDAVVNTWNVEAASQAAAEDAVEAIFERWIFALSEWIGPQMSRVAPVHAAIYHMGDPEPRSPIAEADTGTLDGENSGGLPTEVAVCLSYRAAYVSGEPPARRRGRIFLGPLTTDTLDALTDYVRPSGGLREAMATAAADTANQLVTVGAPWQVFSRVDDAIRPVIGGWVDNEWDTQRRRGREATSRLDWVV